jgi:hypothetical protein
LAVSALGVAEGKLSKETRGPSRPGVRTRLLQRWPCNARSFSVQHRELRVALLDIFTGMANGPRGSGMGGGFGVGHSAGMSPILLAALGLFAYKAAKALGSVARQPEVGQAPRLPIPSPITARG